MSFFDDGYDDKGNTVRNELGDVVRIGNIENPKTSAQAHSDSVNKRRRERIEAEMALERERLPHPADVGVNPFFDNMFSKAGRRIQYHGSKFFETIGDRLDMMHPNNPEMVAAERERHIRANSEWEADKRAKDQFYHGGTRENRKTINEELTDELTQALLGEFEMNRVKKTATGGSW